jgi:hypothetical protein
MSTLQKRLFIAVVAALFAFVALQPEPSQARSLGLFGGGAAIVGGVASAITHTTRSLTVRRPRHSHSSHKTETSAPEAAQKPAKSTDGMTNDYYGPSATSSGGNSGLSSPGF